MHLSKSDFKVARSCPTKLFYKKNHYPSRLDGDPFMELLADGGYMVECIARLLEPDGREIGFNQGKGESYRETMAALQQDEVTLFDATLIFGSLIARVDILRKRGSRIDLVEVKAKSVNGDQEEPFYGTRGGIESGWREYIEDIAFQVHVARNLFPDYEVCPYLRLPDKSKSTSLDLLHQDFELRRNIRAYSFSRPEVRFHGDLNALRRDHFLITRDVSIEVNDVMTDVVAESERFTASLKNGECTKIKPILGSQCIHCEYKISPSEIDENGTPLKNGFNECWNNLAQRKNHILDLHQVGRASAFQKWILESRVDISEINPGELVNGKGEVGTLDTRRLLQIQNTIEGTEYLNPELTRLLNSHRYPLHFIDFEASRLAVPYHAGMRPYEQVCFQWSCHTIRQPGEPIEHAEWINVENYFPNFAFARSLMEHLGRDGTIYIWSQFENTALRDIYEQMEKYHHHDPELKSWIEGTIAMERGDNSRFIDLEKLAREHYFHPDMKGRTSIKVVLPAIWRTNSSLWKHPAFAEYYRLNNDSPIDPYLTLPYLPLDDKKNEVVKEGTGAIRAYHEMLYGNCKNASASRETKKRLLLQYCKLDTAAMIMIWMHWAKKLLIRLNKTI